MSKINNDKYYTPRPLSKHCINKFLEFVNVNDITEVVEPSVGNGSFLDNGIKIDVAYDIDPEIDDARVVIADYITLDLPYKRGRLTIGNPPYGSRMNLAQKFFKKAVETGDYVAFILPISQLNNTQSLYEFDLIYSEDLGVQAYSDRQLHCCFNIYRRPSNGHINDKPKSNLKGIKFLRNDSKGYEEANYDVRICLWGDGTCGKILNESEHYSAEYKISVSDKLENKDEIVNFIKTHDWRSEVNCIAMKKLQKFHFINAIKKQFPNLV